MCKIRLKCLNLKWCVCVVRMKFCRIVLICWLSSRRIIMLILMCVWRNLSCSKWWWMVVKVWFSWMRSWNMMLCLRCFRVVILKVWVISFWCLWRSICKVCICCWCSFGWVMCFMCNVIIRAWVMCWRIWCVVICSIWRCLMCCCRWWLIRVSWGRRWLYVRCWNWWFCSILVLSRLRLCKVVWRWCVEW